MNNILPESLFWQLCLSAAEDAIEPLCLGIPNLRPMVRRGISFPHRQHELAARLERLGMEPRLHGMMMALNQALQTALRSVDVSSQVQRWESLAGCVAAIDGSAQHLLPTFQATFCHAAAAQGVSLQEVDPDAPGGAVETQTQPWETRLMCRVTQMCRAYRKSGTWRLYPADRLALMWAFHLVETGTLPCPSMLPIHTHRRRTCPTYLSLADPGLGHRTSTCLDAEMLKGTIVHIETIDRQGIQETGQMEAYRIPSIRDVARIRVLVGDDAPCSVYVGRPVFEGLQAEGGTRRSADFRKALLKTAHTVAAACSGLFALGVAECKIGLDGLTWREALDYMRALVGNTIRDRSRQRLSAAFNINKPITDDRDDDGNVTVLRDRMDIARAAIEIAQQGGFEKVTWDGAMDSLKPQPILGQITAAELLTLVHAAHERGLETYISAGMTAEHMLVAAQVGVGGVGIGTSLHDRAPGRDTITHINRTAVLRTLEARNLGMKGFAGVVAAELAQLDWQFSRDSDLPPLEAQARQNFFNALLQFHQAADPVAKAASEQRLQGLWDAYDGIRKLALASVATRRTTPPAAADMDVVMELAHKALKIASEDPQSDTNTLRMLGTMIDAHDIDGLKLWLGI
jgi:uncharacterized protein (UPF0264 family)